MQEKNVNVDHVKLLEQAFEQIHAIYFKLTLLEAEYRTNKIVKATFISANRNVLVQQLLQMQEEIYKIIDAHDDVREKFLRHKPAVLARYTKTRSMFDQKIALFSQKTDKLPNYLEKQRQKNNKPKKKEKPS
jgi:hypothetical protein